MELSENQGYAHITGSGIHHEKTEDLLLDEFRNFILFRYAGETIMDNKINTVLFS